MSKLILCAKRNKKACIEVLKMYNQTIALTDVPDLSVFRASAPWPGLVSRRLSQSPNCSVSPPLFKLG